MTPSVETVSGMSAVPDKYPGTDIKFLRAWMKVIAFMLERVFRIRVEGLEHLDLSRPGMIVTNQNAGCWGILNVFSVLYSWYRLHKDPPELVTQGGKIVFTLPIMRNIVKRLGFVRASLDGMREPLSKGKWIFITPGADTDQFRAVWLRNKVRFKKVAWLNNRLVLTDQLGYVSVATEIGCPIYPLAISGTHEMTPVLWEFTSLDRWLGLRWMRRGEHRSCFPLTLNHFINLFIFLLTPFSTSPLAWVIFILANIYFDWLYSYPIFPFQIRLKFGEPIEVPEMPPHSTNKLKLHREHVRLHAQVVSDVNRLHDEVDETRPWIKAFRWLVSPLTRRAVKS